MGKFRARKRRTRPDVMVACTDDGRWCAWSGAAGRRAVWGAHINHALVWAGRRWRWRYGFIGRTPFEASFRLKQHMQRVQRFGGR